MFLFLLLGFILGNKILSFLWKFHSRAMARFVMILVPAHNAMALDINISTINPEDSSARWLIPWRLELG